MNETKFKFIESQLKLQKIILRGRRFTIEEKIFSLFLMKQSQRGYRLLQKVFALASHKTLMMLLNKIPIECGLKNLILKVLKTSVDKMDHRSRHL